MRPLRLRNIQTRYCYDGSVHHIQDTILSAGSLIFVIALIPTILGKDKPAFSTSIVTATVLMVFVGVYASLSLWFSATATAITAICWLTLTLQILVARKNDASKPN